MNAAALVHDLRCRGFLLAAVGGTLQVRPAAMLTVSDRATIRARLPELLAEVTALHTPALPTTRLSDGLTWDQDQALRLMFEADELVARLGVSGLHPEIAATAAMVASAFATHDMETVKFAVVEFEATVRAVFTEQKRKMMCRSPSIEESPPYQRGSV